MSIKEKTCTKKNVWKDTILVCLSLSGKIIGDFFFSFDYLSLTFAAIQIDLQNTMKYRNIDFVLKNKKV